ncbi:MAG TPA: GNAT family N-acetyltransferase [Candidatus Stackebrandtia excrementipullorum]|nr:GNAT family N-acetyltransferase [Candidatus Stackebrandtia excrementipullorum]
MDITRPTITASAVVDAMYEVLLAAHQNDQADNPRPCRKLYTVAMRQKPLKVKHEWRVAHVGGELAGYVGVELPVLDNRHVAFAEVVVHPRFRRRGIGTALIGEAEQIARSENRRSLIAGTIGPTTNGTGTRSEAGGLFLQACGYDLALAETLNRADINGLDPAVEQRLYDAAKEASSDYETIAWTGSTPDELLEPLAVLNGTILDEVPIGDLDLETEKTDPEIMRQNDLRTAERGTFKSNVVARKKGSTDIVANTVIAVNTEPIDVAHQWITIVSPQHRGHKLGMRIKMENHAQLRAAKPQVRWVHTGNADGNVAMLSINEKLGFKNVDAWQEYQKSLSNNAALSASLRPRCPGASLTALQSRLPTYFVGGAVLRLVMNVPGRRGSRAARASASLRCSSALPTHFVGGGRVRLATRGPDGAVLGVPDGHGFGARAARSRVARMVLPGHPPRCVARRPCLPTS